MKSTLRNTNTQFKEKMEILSDAMVPRHVENTGFWWAVILLMLLIISLSKHRCLNGLLDVLYARVKRH